MLTTGPFGDEIMLGFTKLVNGKWKDCPQFLRKDWVKKHWKIIKPKESKTTKHKAKQKEKDFEDFQISSDDCDSCGQSNNVHRVNSSVSLCKGCFENNKISGADPELICFEKRGGFRL
jgi:hypothetical protein